MMHPITTTITVRDNSIDQYSAIETADVISIWDHAKGDEVAKVDSWAYAAWVLALLQSL